MSKKYVGQINNPNFVYPNNSLAQYETEIVHNINNNSVSGTITSFTATTTSSTGITVNFNYTWLLNGAEPFVEANGDYSFLSVHMMDPSKLFYKPFRLVYKVSGTAATTKSGSVSFVVTPDQMGITSFTNGTYYFEVRMIGKRAVLPICQTQGISTIVVPTPTPTPTPTITPSQVTPTPTPSTTPSNLIYFSGATLNVTDTGWIKYTSPSGDTYQFISSLGTNIITNCAICSTFSPGYPFADVAGFTVSSCGSSCGSVPPPTPTPSASPAAVYYYYRLTRCGTFETFWSQLYPSGTFNSGDRVEGGVGIYYVISGSQTTNPGTTLYSVTRVPGATGCP